MTGQFITPEGGEGAGKSTQARRLCLWLEAQGIPALITREPGGTAGAEAIRSLLISGEHQWDRRAETLLHFAARAEHVEKVIRPALAAGTWVVSDRFFDSTLAYQGFAQGSHIGDVMDLIRQGGFSQGSHLGDIMHLIRIIGLQPDLTIMLDIFDATSEQRLKDRGGVPDRYELMGAAFHRMVNAAFRSIAAWDTDRCVVVSAEAPIDAVHEAVTAVVRDRFMDRASTAA